MNKKHYIYPYTEIALLNTERLMALGDPSNKASGGSGSGAPERRAKVF